MKAIGSNILNTSCLILWFHYTKYNEKMQTRNFFIFLLYEKDGLK